jgi:hypothetical protein
LHSMMHFCYSLKLLAFYNEQISDVDLFSLQQPEQTLPKHTTL